MYREETVMDRIRVQLSCEGKHDTEVQIYKEAWETSKGKVRSQVHGQAKR